VSEDTATGASEDVPERPGGTANFFRAINVERNAKLGFGIGIILALGLLAVIVANATSSDYPVFLYAGLAFVLATGVGLLLTMVFTVGSLVRKARELDEER
jgi:fucose permease